MLYKKLKIKGYYYFKRLKRTGKTVSKCIICDLNLPECSIFRKVLCEKLEDGIKIVYVS